MSSSPWRLARYDQRRELGSQALASFVFGGLLLCGVLAVLAQGDGHPLFLAVPVILLPFVLFWSGIPRDHWLLKSPHVRHRDAIRVAIKSFALILLAPLARAAPWLPMELLVIVAIALNIALIWNGFIGAVLVYTSFETSRRVTWSFVVFLCSSYPPDVIVSRAMREDRGLTPNEQLLLDLYLRDVLLQGYFPPPARVSRTYRARVRAYTARVRQEIEGVESAVSRLREERSHAAESAHSAKLKKLREEFATQHQKEKSHVV